jgi:hypothetical protein
MTADIRYAVIFDGIEAALDAHVNAHGTEVMELRPDGVCRAVQWDGEQPPQPCTEPVPELPCDEGIITYIARRLAENPPPCPPGWTPACNLKMPAPAPAPDPDQAES